MYHPNKCTPLFRSCCYTAYLFFKGFRNLRKNFRKYSKLSNSQVFLSKIFAQNMSRAPSARGILQLFRSLELAWQVWRPTVVIFQKIDSVTFDDRVLTTLTIISDINWTIVWTSELERDCWWRFRWHCHDKGCVSSLRAASARIFCIGTYFWKNPLAQSACGALFDA